MAQPNHGEGEGAIKVARVPSLRTELGRREPALASRLLADELGGFGCELIRLGGYPRQIQPVEGVNEVHQREYE